MKDVVIIHVFNGIFFSNGIQYKYESSYNTRIVCHQVDDPSKVIQFPSCETVQVTDEEAKKIKAFLIDVYMMERSSLASRKKDIKRLQEQGVESYMDHFLDVILEANQETNDINKQVNNNDYATALRIKEKYLKTATPEQMGRGFMSWCEEQIKHEN